MKLEQQHIMTVIKPNPNGFIIPLEEANKIVEQINKSPVTLQLGSSVETTVGSVSNARIVDNSIVADLNISRSHEVIVAKIKQGFSCNGTFRGTINEDKSCTNCEFMFVELK